MKSLLLLDHFNRHGGAQEYLIDIAIQLQSMGLDLAISNVQVESLQPAADKIHKTGFTLLGKNSRNPFLFVSFIKNIFQIKKYLTENKIGIIHCNSIPALALAKLARLKGQRIVFTCHDCNLSSQKLNIVKQCADQIICVSDTVKRYLDSCGITQKKGVIYNGFFELPENLYKRSREDNKVIFGLVGRMERWKGCHLFIEAAKRTLNHCPINVEFHLIGYSEDNRYLTNLQQSIGSNQNILFKPFENKKSLIFSNLDVVVNASIEIEPFGRTLVEAGIRGLPSIGPSQGGPAEIIVHGKTGLLFQPRNPQDLSEKFNIILKSKALREKMGKESRKNYLERFSIKKICNQLIGYYSEL